MYTTTPFAQSDALYMTHVGNNNAVVNTVTYDRNNAVTAPWTFVLSGDQQRLEIELLLDGNECVDSKTEITMTMATTQPVLPTQPALNRLANMDSSVAVCSNPYTAGCACTVKSGTGPKTIIPWPWDECNECVLIGSSSSCNGMGQNFDKEVSITYNLYVENMPVTSTSIVIGKLKKTFPYNPAAR